MARGWESKSVESQQAEAADRKQPGRARLSPEQAEKERERQGLLLRRRRVIDQMSNATVPAHQAMLRAALADLDSRLAALDA